MYCKKESLQTGPFPFLVLHISYSLHRTVPLSDGVRKTRLKRIESKIAREAASKTQDTSKAQNTSNIQYTSYTQNTSKIQILL